MVLVAITVEVVQRGAQNVGNAERVADDDQAT